MAEEKKKQQKPATGSAPRERTYELELEPGVGFGGAKLGGSKDEFATLFGEPNAEHRGSTWYLDTSIKVEFERGKAAFIEINGPPSRVLPTFRGVRVLEVEEPALAALFDPLDALDADAAADGCTRQYNGLPVVFWREANPDWLRAELDELDDPDDRRLLEDEIARCSRFQTVAVFRPGYFD